MDFMILTLIMLEMFMFYTPAQLLSKLLTGSSFTKYLLASRVENSIDSDQFSSQRPDDLDQHCFQTRIYQGYAW